MPGYIPSPILNPRNLPTPPSPGRRHASPTGTGVDPDPIRRAPPCRPDGLDNGPCVEPPVRRKASHPSFAALFADVFDQGRNRFGW